MPFPISQTWWGWRTALAVTLAVTVMHLACSSPVAPATPATCATGTPPPLLRPMVPPANCVRLEAIACLVRSHFVVSCNLSRFFASGGKLGCSPWKKEQLKGDLKQGSIPCPVDGNEIQNTPPAVFPFDLWSDVFRTDLWKSWKHGCGSCHFVSGSLCLWTHEQGQYVWHLHLFQHYPIFFCSSMVRSALRGSNLKQKQPPHNKTKNKQTFVCCMNIDPRREAGDVWCLPPVWNLRAVIWFLFPISSLVFSA